MAPRSSALLLAIHALLALNICSALQHEHAGRQPLAALHDSGLPNAYNEHRFRRRVDKALASVRKLLHSARKPTYAESVPHLWDDKYALANFLTTTSIAAQLNVLESLGLGRTQLAELAKVASSGVAVTLRLRARERTQYVREATRDVSDGRVQKHSTMFFASESQTVTRLTEYFWRHEVEHELVALRGANTSTATGVPLQRRTASAELVTQVKESPQPEVREPPPVDVDVTWLLQQLQSPSLTIHFAIDRTAPTCRTPRRNQQVNAAVASAAGLHHWATSVHNYFQRVWARLPPPRGPKGQPSAALDVSAIAERAAEIFVPVLPLFEPPNATTAAAADSAHKQAANQPAAASGGGAASVGASTCAAPLLPRLGDVHAFLAEQRRSLQAAGSALDASFPHDAQAEGGGGGGGLISSVEARMCVYARHMRDVLAQYSDAIEYIEHLLREQLAHAIGKELAPTDFATFMVQHEQRLYAQDVAPAPFTFAVRREGHSPEGVVAIEGGAAANAADEPVRTIHRQLNSSADLQPMSFALNAATRVSFGGERHVHAYLAHQWGNGGDNDETPFAPPPTAAHPLRLAARARQFSSFLLLVGRLGPSRTFEPAHALIVKDKDELHLPLNLEALPTPKAFRDAIASLSPEQQRFASAVRSMQLAGSAFGILVLQVKPQLERLLRLPPLSLTKQIGLTQSLLDLFITYQIPSDLLAYDGNETVPTAEKLSAVREHVKAITDLIDAAKKEEVAAEKQKADFAHPHAHAAGGAAAAEVEEDADDEVSASPRVALMARSRKRSVNRLYRSAAPMAKMSMAAPPVEMAAVAMADVVEMDGAAPSIAAEPVPSTEEQPTPPRTPKDGAATAVQSSPTGAMDFTALPQTLEAAYDQLDTDAAIRPTRIHVGTEWVKRHQRALLASPSESTIDAGEQAREKAKAYDLLDALSRSGALPFEAASLHVLVAATHRFDLSLIETVIAANVNPIEKLERSSLIMASTIHGRPAAELIGSDAQRERIRQFSAPALLKVANAQAHAQTPAAATG